MKQLLQQALQKGDRQYDNQYRSYRGGNRDGDDIPPPRRDNATFRCNPVNKANTRKDDSDQAKAVVSKAQGDARQSTRIDRSDRFNGRNPLAAYR